MAEIYGLKFRGAVGTAPTVMILAATKETAQEIADWHNAQVGPVLLHMAGYDVIELDGDEAIRLIHKHTGRGDDGAYQANAERADRVGEPQTQAEARPEADRDAAAAEAEQADRAPDQGSRL